MIQKRHLLTLTIEPVVIHCDKETIKVSSSKSGQFDFTKRTIHRGYDIKKPKSKTVKFKNIYN